MVSHHITLPFARKDTVDLYVCEKSGELDIFTGNAPTRECFWASRVIGRLKDVYFDQRKNLVPWEIVPLPDFCRSPEGDSRHNQIVDGHEPTVDHIRYDVANAMNRVIQDRGFSRFVKKHLVGSWEAEDSKLQFFSDGNYRIVESARPLLYAAPEKGRWSVGGRMLYLMTEANDRGERIALVSISESELRFHGRDGALFHIYRRA